MRPSGRESTAEQMLYFFLLVALLIPLMAVFLDSRVGQALAARLERPSQDRSAEEERTAALEAEVERLADEVRRLREQGEFLERLIARRGAAGELPPAAAAPTALPRPQAPGAGEGGAADE